MIYTTANKRRRGCWYLVSSQTCETTSKRVYTILVLSFNYFKLRTVEMISDHSIHKISEHPLLLCSIILLKIFHITELQLFFFFDINGVGDETSDLPYLSMHMSVLTQWIWIHWCSRHVKTLQFSIKTMEGDGESNALCIQLKKVYILIFKLSSNCPQVVV